MKRTYLHLAVLLLLAMITSCAKDWNYTTSDDKQEGPSQIMLRIKTPSGFSSGATTRSLTVEDEHKIENIWVLAFNAQNELTEVREGENLQDIDATTRSFTVTLQRSKNAQDTYNLMVLANAENIITTQIGTDLDKISDKSYTAITALLNEAISGKMYASGGTIPMGGESGALEIKLGVNNNISLSLLRSVARIDIGVGVPQQETDGTYKWSGKDNKDNKIPFELKEVYVVKANNRYAVVPDMANISGSKATAPTIPANTTPFTIEQSVANFKYSDLEITASTIDFGSYTTQSIYIPEADVKLGTDAKSGDANHESRMAIVVGGDYNNSGRTTYYRLDLAKGGDILNALRNHLYQFNISQVSGFGYTDVETAYKSLSMNMQVDILDWDEAEMGDVIFDGQNYFSISKSKVEFSPMGNESETVTIKTNVKTIELWEEREGGEHLEMKLGGTTTYANDNMGYKYTLTTVTAGSIYNLKIEATKHNVSNTVPDRLDKWRIKANRLNAKFEVDQQYTVLYVSYVNGQSQNLYPEGTLANTIPIEIMALKPVAIKAEEGSAEATWIKLGDISGLTTGNAGLYQARLEVEVEPFIYTTGVSTLRTGTITVTPQGENPRVFTINQESPVFKFAKTTETVTRKSGTIYQTYVDVITNLAETDFKIIKQDSVGDQAWRITHKDVFYNVDKTNPRSRRFDVDVDMQSKAPMGAQAFEKSFTAQVDTKYGQITMPTVTFDVLAGNVYFDWFWNNTIVPPAQTPFKFSAEDNSPQYYFPWQTTSATIQFNQNTGVQYNAAHTNNKPGKGSLAKVSDVSDTDYTITLYTFTFNKANYNIADSYDLYFKSVGQGTTLEKDVKMGLGLQMFKRVPTTTTLDINYKGYTEASPYAITLTSNVDWEAAVTSSDNSIIKMRPNTGTTWVTPPMKVDARVTEPEILKSAYNAETNLVKTNAMGIAIEPYNTLNATPTTRVITVEFKNNSYATGAQGGATMGNPTLKFTQYAPILKYSSGAPGSIIDYFGGTYTIYVSTNIQSWGVKVYDATTNQLVASQAYGTSGIYSTTASSRSVSITIPRYNATQDRTLSFRLYHNASDISEKEIEIRTQTQSSVDYVVIDGLKWKRGNLIAIDTNPNRNGSNACTVGSPNDAGVFFQFGSLVGWSGGTNGDGVGWKTTSAATQKVWPSVMNNFMPTNYWKSSAGADISKLENKFFDYSIYPWNQQWKPDVHIGSFAVSISGDTGKGTLADGRYASFGVGDPCTFYLGSPWRMPTALEASNLVEKNNTWSQSYLGVRGRWFGSNLGNTTTSIFLAAVGHRRADGGIWEVNNEVRVGTASIFSAWNQYYMYINYNSVKPGDNTYRPAAHTARCVSK